MKFYKKYSYLMLLVFLALVPFNFIFGLLAILCMVAPIILSLFGKGRYSCGNLCPRGNFYDNILSKFSRGKKTPKFLKSTLFRIAMVIFLLFMFTTGVIKNWGNAEGIGFIFYRLILVTTIVAIILGIVFNERAWCNFCPMGSIGGFIAKIRGRNKGIVVENSCVSCNLCSKKCPMGLEPKDFKGGVIDSTLCISCGKCTPSCPKSALEFKKVNK
ncbi:4Fe-4S binding protein [Clostridium sp.]|uniref:4Fe-4S binding protein n=1 Tax=Clostridium sp. TaxID=1506 RepID=UPI002FC8CF91